MDNFTFKLPTRFVFGKGTETEAGRLVAHYGGTKVLVLFGGGSVVRSGLLKRVCDSLDRALLDYVELGGVKPNPRASLVYEGISLVADEKIDFILAVGGGSVIDAAKVIAGAAKYDGDAWDLVLAAGACYRGDFWDFYEGDRAPDEALPIGCVLTIAASGSEASPDSVITQDKTMLKRETSADVLLPTFSILNPELTETLPAYQTAAGIVDMYSHLLERYLTNTCDVEVTDRMIEGLMLAIIVESAKVMANLGDYEARANIMWAATLAHNNMAGGAQSGLGEPRDRVRAVVAVRRGARCRSCGGHARGDARDARARRAAFRSLGTQRLGRRCRGRLFRRPCRHRGAARVVRPDGHAHDAWRDRWKRGRHSRAGA